MKDLKEEKVEATNTHEDNMACVILSHGEGR